MPSHLFKKCLTVYETSEYPFLVNQSNKQPITPEDCTRSFIGGGIHGIQDPRHLKNIT